MQYHMGTLRDRLPNKCRFTLSGRSVHQYVLTTLESLVERLF
jgi:hypothetical protein